MPDAPSTRDQHYRIARALIDAGHATRPARLAALSAILGRPVAAFAAMTRADAETVLAAVPAPPAAPPGQAR